MAAWTWPDVQAKISSLQFSEDDQGQLEGRLLAMPDEKWALYLHGSDAIVIGRLKTLLPAGKGTLAEHM